MNSALEARSQEELRHQDWLLRHGLIRGHGLERYRAYGLPELIDLSYPGAPVRERRLLLDVLGWFTLLDDHFDGPIGHHPPSAGEFTGRLIAVTRAAGRPRVPLLPPADRGDALLGAWTELWYRQCLGRSRRWRRRAARDWADCLRTFVTETEHRSRGTLPGGLPAVLMRRHASCLYPFMNLLERVADRELPRGLCLRADWRRLRAQTADAATLINDLFSLEREERQGNGFNTVTLLRREFGLSRETARRVVADRTAGLRAESELLRSGLVLRHPGARWYLEGTRQLVDGVYAWTSASRRYRSS
ncbi:terpene synthase family protein [Kitasatospora sp. NPDC004289]